MYVRLYEMGTIISFQQWIEDKLNLESRGFFLFYGYVLKLLHLRSFALIKVHVLHTV